MADCYGMLGHGGHRPFLDAFQSAKQAALHALALDDGLSTAHWAYAGATWICDWNLATCGAEMLRAIQLNPSDEEHELIAWPAHSGNVIDPSFSIEIRIMRCAEVR